MTLHYRNDWLDHLDGCYWIHINSSRSPQVEYTPAHTRSNKMHFASGFCCSPGTSLGVATWLACGSWAASPLTSVLPERQDSSNHRQQGSGTIFLHKKKKKKKAKQYVIFNLKFSKLGFNDTQNVQMLPTFHLGLLETNLHLFHTKIPKELLLAQLPVGAPLTLLSKICTLYFWHWSWAIWTSFSSPTNWETVSYTRTSSARNSKVKQNKTKKNSNSIKAIGGFIWRSFSKLECHHGTF